MAYGYLCVRVGLNWDVQLVDVVRWNVMAFLSLLVGVSVRFFVYLHICCHLSVICAFCPVTGIHVLH